MNIPVRSTLALSIVLCLTSVPASPIEELTLYPVRFAQGREVVVPMLPTRHLPGTTMRGKVRLEEGLARVKLEYRGIKPAVLFGGEATCYVAWAVNRDGAVQNLGELWVDPGNPNGEQEFSTGYRNFALLVTVEAYYQVDQPSEFVVFWNDKTPDPPVLTDELRFTSFSPPPTTGIQTLEHVRLTGDKPVELLQAERVFALAQKTGAQEYAGTIFADARIALEQATVMATRSRQQGAAQFARRSTAAGNEAIKLTLRKKQMEELDRQVAERRAQMAALEQRAQEAETLLQQVTAQRQKVQAELKDASDQLGRMSVELEQIQLEKASLTDELEMMRTEQGRLEESMTALRQEKEMLQDRLEGALAQVAETRDSARGVIVNLPDILFSINEASLQPEARIVLAKLVGILLIMSDLELRIEGHTDSTGSPAYNMRLSQQRADSVFDFLAQQGISSQRMTAAGYGLEHPIADNSTAEGRRQNRRVEIVISQASELQALQ